MKILVDINHPAHVHLFKNFIWQMEKNGHEFLVTAYNKEVTFKLLNNYGIKYENMGVYRKNIFLKLIDLFRKDIKMCFLVMKFKPDLILGHGSVNAAHVGWLMNVKSVITDDDEYSFGLYNFFATKILGFSGFKKKGAKIININSFKELAYLHPNYFTPDKSVFKEFGLEEDASFFIIRLVAWQSGHDLGRTGLSLEHVREIVKILKNYGKIIISSEKPLPNDLVEFGMKISPERLHDALSFAKILICDSQTMATEAAVLGTPVVRCNSFVGSGDMNNFKELENKYGLIFSFSDSNKAIQKINDLIKTKNLQSLWQIKRNKLIAEKVDVTQKMIEIVEEIGKI